MYCMKCKAEDNYDIVDRKPTKRRSGHYIKCKECGCVMFLAMNGEVYDIKHNQMVDARYLQEEFIESNRISERKKRFYREKRR